MTARIVFLAGLWTAMCVTLARGEDWPQFLGPRRDGTSLDTELPATFPDAKKSVLWRRKVGHGLSGLVVAQGKLILFHQPADEEIVDCMDASTGKSLWSVGYPSVYQGGYGTGPGPRATPVVDRGVVFTMGGAGVLQALDLASGKILWRRETQKEFNVSESYFGVGSTPLVEGDLLLVNLGAKPKAGLAAFNRTTGDTIWTKVDDEASYSSPVAASIDGQRLALFFSRTGLYGVDPKTGEQQFFVRWRARINASVNAATPIVSGNQVFISSAYNTGALLLSVDKKGAEKVWAGDDALTNHFNTSVLSKGYLFGVDGRQDLGDVRLACIEWATGKRQWTKEGLGCANLILAGDRILACCENGELVWFAADPAGYRELARVEVLTGLCRPAPALANGKLYLRSETELVCFDLRAK